MCNAEQLWYISTAPFLWKLSFALCAGLGEDAEYSQQFYMNIYAIISLFQVSAALVNQLDLKHLSTVAADTLHRSMLDKLLRAPMSFFHTTPIGRIINRLTRDTSDIDKNLADFVAMFLR